ncbi:MULTISPECIES: SixA phosphatase family protein [Chromobacteriaceae]|uniref:Histidine phosphatase family protein n=3 Tax=Chromobacteriaceae TaxID=1499392 RepID=A0ABV0H452_9NEIS|nr:MULTISPECIES: histidine phosphatase family protein [Chromobacteriaceae]AVG18427.1 histidine phosphatase family protein [Chromobacterium vaccinii]ERE07258.1 phosphohistidine phosphatase [Pseudogulbenkiania ferrooxidans EGD-HP2]MBX9345589.1 histidine phosphatase family protein [Chromobacterium vaccinii]MCD4503268.1 histidine phosphatase family protein [Chromobacterium piscinae]MCD5329048.1 histidine phosphatase family protein [Chromobacterium piscinae]
MDLILWRHAEAEDGIDDLARALTRRGQQQASRMASWLRDRLPDDYLLLASEAKRSQQTAAYLAKSYEVMPELNPGADVDEVLQAVGWPEAGRTVVVAGHQPYIGWLAARLLSEQQQMWSVKKGSVWWLNRRERGGYEQVRLKLMLTPGMLEP